MTQLRFILVLTTAALLLWGLAWLIPPSSAMKPTLVLTIIVPSLFMNLISWRWTTRNSAGDGLVRRFLAALVIKMIAQLMLIVFISLQQPESQAANAIFAMVCHITGMGLEVKSLYALTRS